jgi:uncharacterized protein YhaN
MRLSRLGLPAYGHFTDAGFDLPVREPDIHFVLGPNEAGKSTALAAVEDLFFGIPKNTPYGFQHGYGDMLLAAAIEGQAGTFEFKRRKGTRDTLLSKDGFPVPGGEALLLPFLNGIDRAFYSRMFCLDHKRLQEGGREILDAQNDVGQILFSAGAGVARLREFMRKLRADADALWASRRAGHRAYFQAEDRLKEADDFLRQHLITAKHWHELKTVLDQANDAYQAIEAEIETKTAESRRLGRIRRVCRYVQRHAGITARLEAFKDVPSLSDDAGPVLDSALKDESTAEIRLATLLERTEALRRQRSTLTYDEALLARSADVDQLHERRIQIRGFKADLPKRRAELLAAEANLAALAAELDWPVAEPAETISRLPARAKLTHGRALSQRRGEVLTTEHNTRGAHSEVDQRITALTEELAAQGAARDLAELRAILNVIRPAGDIEGRISAAELEAQTATTAVQKIFRSMRPAVSAEIDISSLAVPQKSAIEYHRDRARGLAQSLQSCRDQIRNIEFALVEHQNEYQRLAREERAVPAEELQGYRGRRDTGWAIIRRKYIEDGDVSESEIRAFTADDLSLPEAYEAAVRDADGAADRRYDTAEATGRLAEIARQIAGQEARLEQFRGQERGYSKDEAILAKDWTDLWSGLPLTPLAPDDMLAWVEARTQLLQAADAQAAAALKTASLRAEERTYREQLVGELARLGFSLDAPASQSLRALVEYAVDKLRENETQLAGRRRLEQDLAKARTDLARQKQRLREAADAAARWQTDWSSTMRELNLNPEGPPESLDAQMETLGAMREVATKINELRQERVEKMERDIAAFETQVSGVVASLAPQLVGAESEEAVLELEKLLRLAKQAQAQAAKTDADISAETKRTEECQELRRASRGVISRLQKAAGVSTLDDLRNVIALSGERRSLQAELAKNMRTLIDDGDGKSLPELAAECASVDLDQIAAAEQRISQELEDLQQRRVEAGQSSAAARREFDAVGGDDRVARAAADRQAALAEMSRIAEHYIRARAAELLLQAAVDRYRREKQAPLLKRAGELFAILTCGSFGSLQVSFDASDNMQLVGVRPGGRTVPVAGMSDGSADQLYLALRVAAVEDFLDNATPIPFIADDLFINFDERRAAAGLKVLGELAHKTQVIFFTHHRHLIEIANTALDTNVSIINLPEPAILPADAGEDSEAQAPLQRQTANG